MASRAAVSALTRVALGALIAAPMLLSGCGKGDQAGSKDDWVPNWSASFPEHAQESSVPTDAAGGDKGRAALALNRRGVARLCSWEASPRTGSEPLNGANGDFTNAAELFKAAALPKGYQSSQSNLGVCLDVQVRPKEAATALSAGATAEGADGRALNNLGWYEFHDADNAEKARRLFEQAAERRCDMARVNLAVLHIRQGHTQDAGALIEQVLGAPAPGPNPCVRHAALINRGEVARLEGRFADALSSYREALDLRSRDPHVRLRAAAMAMAIGDYEAARSDADLAATTFQDIRNRRRACLLAALADVLNPVQGVAPEQAVRRACEQARVTRDPDVWEGLLLSVLAGETDAERLRGCLHDSPDPAERGKRCEAGLVLGVRGLQAVGAKDERGLADLRQAAGSGAVELIEFSVATALASQPH